MNSNEEIFKNFYYELGYQSLQVKKFITAIQKKYPDISKKEIKE